MGIPQYFSTNYAEAPYPARDRGQCRSEPQFPRFLGCPAREPAVRRNPRFPASVRLGRPRPRQRGRGAQGLARRQRRHEGLPGRGRWRGQYAYPDGLFFGGRKPTWSNETFRAIVKKHGAGAQRVGVIDFHSGLGPAGYGEPLSIVAPGAPAFERARAWWGDEVTSTADGTSKSPPVTGPLIGSVDESLPRAEVTAIGLEYGTIELIELLDALRGDNWLYARGLKSGLSMDSALARDIKAKVRDALTIDTDEWKEKVYARAADFALKAFRGLSGQ